MHQVLYGIECDAKGEKRIVERVKAYLDGFERTISTVKKGGALMRNRKQPIKQFHWNLNNDTGTYLEIFPNVDLHGNAFVLQAEAFAWLLMVIHHVDRPGYGPHSEPFVIGMLDAIGLPYETLFEGSGERVEGGIDRNR